MPDRNNASVNTVPLKAAVLFFIVIVEYISAFGTELRRISRILRLPAAFIAAVERCALRFFCAATLAEFTLVHRAARTSPASLVSRFRRTAFGTEFSGSHGSALAFPSACRRLWLRLFPAAVCAEVAADRSPARAFPTVIRRC